MNYKSKNHQKRSRSFSRRNFISACGVCSACVVLSPTSAFYPGPAAEGRKKTKIRIVYSLHDLVQPRPDWPNIGFNFEPVIENINNSLRKQFPAFEFISTTASGENEAKRILLQDEEAKIDGYIVYQMNCWNRVVQTIAKSMKPVLYVDFQYGGSGGFLVYNSAFLNENQPNIGFVSSSRFADLADAVKCFEITANGGSLQEFVAATKKVRVNATPLAGKFSWKADDLDALSADDCLRRLKETKILAVKDQNAGLAESIMGIALEYIPFSEVNQAWENADKEEANIVAEKWQNNASEVIDVTTDEIKNSAAMYLGMKSVLKNHGANAITINCLGGFYGNHIHAYPCLGFHELNNEGLIGACECDISSTATMVAFTTMTQGRPGYISDPVIDTSKNQIIYAHCVAPNKMFGPKGASNSYSIMNHSEDRQGASVRSVLPVDCLTTTLKLNNQRKEIIFHQAMAVDNDPDDRACRTKLCAEPVGDVEKLFTHWHDWGWHRVTFYGDLKEQVYEMADATGWTVIEEA